VICPETRMPCVNCCEDMTGRDGICWFQCVRATWFWFGFTTSAALAALIAMVLA
jgi:hypothetical protein